MLMTINNSYKEYRATPEVGDGMSIMAVRSGTQERLFAFSDYAVTSCRRSKAALKLKSSTIRCCWDAGRGLAISKRLFTGLRLIVRFFDFPDETRRLLGPGETKEGTSTGTYSTRPSSTIFEILTPDRDVESSDDGPNATHRIPLLLWVFHHPPPIKSLIHALTHVSHNLRTRCSLHVAPWLENSAVRDPVSNPCRLS